jgi:hypothetical protein
MSQKLIKDILDLAYNLTFKIVVNIWVDLETQKLYNIVPLVVYLL